MNYNNFPLNNNISAANAKINNIDATNARLNNMAATNFRLNNIAATNARLNNIVATNARLNNIAATNAKINNIAATNAKMNNIAATNAKMNNIAATNAKLNNPSTKSEPSSVNKKSGKKSGEKSGEKSVGKGKNTKKIIIIAVVVFVLLLVIGLVIWLIYRSKSKSSTPSGPSSAPSSAPAQQCPGYTIISGKDFVGNRSAAPGVSSPSQTDCYNQCTSTSDCQWFSYNSPNALCYANYGTTDTGSVLGFKIVPADDSCPQWKSLQNTSWSANSLGVPDNTYGTEQECQNYCDDQGCDFYTYDSGTGLCQLKEYVDSPDVSIGFSND